MDADEGHPHVFELEHALRHKLAAERVIGGEAIDERGEQELVMQLLWGLTSGEDTGELVLGIVPQCSSWGKFCHPSYMC